MYCRSRLRSSHKVHRLLCPLLLAVLILAAAPTVVFGATAWQRSDPPPYAGVLSGIQAGSWGKAPAWGAGLSGDLGVATLGGEVIVEFARGTQSQAMIKTAGAAGATLGRARPSKSGKTMPFSVYRSASLTTAQLMAKLKSQPGVVAVAPNGRLRLSDIATSTEGLQTATEGLAVPDDPLFGSQWALENTGQVAGTVDADIDARAAWGLTVGSGSVVVAVIDSGVDYDHPDLAANIWTNAGEETNPSDGLDNDTNNYVDDLYGIDVVNDDGDPLDDNGHGYSPSALREPITWLYEQNDPRITYLGPWSTRWAGSASQGSFYFKQSVYSSGPLEPGPHTLTVKCKGVKNPSSGGLVVDVDALRIVGVVTAGPTPTRFQQDASLIGYTGTWGKGFTWSASGGSFKCATTAGAGLRVTFEGTYLAWIAKTGSWYGKALVTLDDGQPFYVDLYSSTSKYKQQVYDTGLLEPGRHSLTIRWTGLKNWRAQAAQIDVDAFDLLGTLEAETP